MFSSDWLTRVNQPAYIYLPLLSSDNSNYIYDRLQNGEKEMNGARSGKVYTQESRQTDMGNLEKEVVEEKKYVQGNTRDGCCSQSPNNLILHG